MDADRTGQFVGIWRLLELIGHGGMGNLYRAERIDGVVVDTDIAVKILHAGATAGALDEAATLRGLDHPNIVRYRDSGMTDDGCRFLAMDFVDGVPITDYADQRGLNIASRLRLFLKVCEAVSFAHKYLMLHLDLKPANILVDKDGCVKVVDFGIARRLDEGGAPPPSGAGSFPYASPEQIRRDLWLGYPADVYGLGTVLYELLCGHEPFNPGLAPDELQRQILEDAPVAPSLVIGNPKVRALGAGKYVQVEPERLAKMRGVGLPGARKELRGHLDRICLYALRKEPRRRYKMVDELSSDIEEVFKNEEPRHAHSNGFGYLVWRTIKRQPVVLSVVVFAIACSYSFVSLSNKKAEFRRANMESSRQVDQVTESALRELSGTLHPMLVSDPRLRGGLESLERELRVVRESAVTVREQMQRDGQGLLDRLGKAVSGR